jgi:hypothetical protein
MAHDLDDRELNTDAQPQNPRPEHARPEDPDRNTQPRGNGDHDERDTERGRDKLDSVLGQ